MYIFDKMWWEDKKYLKKINMINENVTIKYWQHLKKIFCSNK